jgi:hypothetical protein
MFTHSHPTRTRRHTALAVASMAAVLLIFARPALAGPPFICHAFELSGSPSLPWGTGSGWNTPDPAYDLDRLPGDVTRLLTASMPVSARMETLRRATIYAARDKAVAAKLLTLLVTRAEQQPKDAHALFDAGFLVEAYRQATRVYKWDMLSARDRDAWTLRDAPTSIDGATLMATAVELSGKEGPEMRKARVMARQGRGE